MRNRTGYVIVTVDNKQLEFQVKNNLQMFTYEEAEDKDDMMTLVITSQGNILNLIDSDIFKLGKKIKVSWGWAEGPMSPARTFTLKAPEVVYGKEIVLTLRGLDVGNSLKSAESNKLWKKTTHSQVAIDIATQYKLEHNVLVTDQEFEIVGQGNRTDFDLLKYLATLNIDYVFYIDNETLHFHKRDFKKKSQRTYYYYQKDESEILRFTPGVKTQNQVQGATSTKALSYDPLTKKGIKHTADSKSDKQLALGKVLVHVNLETGAIREEQVGKILTTTHKDPIKQAEQHRNNMQADDIESKLTIDGDPLIEGKSVITLAGLGEKFSGNYYTKRVRHKIGSAGFYTEFDLTRNALNAPIDDGGKPNQDNSKKGPDNSKPKTRDIKVNLETGAISG